jgi:hypothetical protein
VPQDYDGVGAEVISEIIDLGIYLALNTDQIVA